MVNVPHFAEKASTQAEGDVMTTPTKRTINMGAFKWMLIGFVAISLVAIGALVYDAVARSGETGSLIIAGVWLAGLVAILASVRRSVANR